MMIPPESYWHALDLEPWCCWLFEPSALLAVAWIGGTAVCCGCVPRAGAFFTPGTQATGAYSPSPQEATRLSSLRPGVHVGAAL